MADIITAHRLVKWYGPHPAVRDVSFSVGEGEVIGLLGPNGSGKSTILRILTGYLTPSTGTATIAGLDVQRASLAIRRQVGYVAEDAPLYDHMRVEEFLRFMARIKGLSGAAVGRAVAAAIERLRLQRVARLLIAKLSRGYRQRVAIAQALLNDPKVLILDEPTSALDPYQVIVIRDLILDLAGRQTILLASHVLAEIEKVASRVMVLLDGKLLSADAMREIPAAPRLRLRVAGPADEIRACLAAVPGVRAASGEAPPVYLVETEARPDIAARLAAAVTGRGFALTELMELRPDLERVFLDLTTRAAAVPS